MDMNPNGVACMGPPCSSWGLPARGTSQRTVMNIYGNIFSHWVRSNTAIVSRAVLLILVLLANNCLFILEQPRQSLLSSHRRFNWLVNYVAYVCSSTFWMQKHGHPSPKPTVCYSNMPEIYKLDLGKLTKVERLENTTLKTTRLFDEFYWLFGVGA
ncbi:unnamed protein product [Durusdinium trenchii]|uniref:Uncharacterized protein n=2 Tax=Durusdinium trenchii TaxID=1381693 RepID=A0ABP0P856_9DINO